MGDYSSPLSPPPYTPAFLGVGCWGLDFDAGGMPSEIRRGADEEMESGGLLSVSLVAFCGGRFYSLMVSLSALNHVW